MRKEEIQKSIESDGLTSPIEQQSEPKSISRGAFSRVKRQLSNSDLKNPAVGRLLLSQNDKYEQEIGSLEEYKEKYYDADKRAAVFLERINGIKEGINSRSVFLTFGGILLGALPSLWSRQFLFWAVALIGIIFLLIGFFRKSKNDK